jgi:protein TonB
MIAGTNFTLDSSPRRRWWGLAGSVLIHGAMAGVILAWPARDPAIAPATLVDLVLAQPAPPPSSTAIMEQPVLPPSSTAIMEQPVLPVRRPVAQPAPAIRFKTSVAATAPTSFAIAAPAVAASDEAPAGQEGASASSPAPVAVSGSPAVEDVKAVAVSRPKPFYPRIARQRGWQGVVVVHVAIDEAGQAWQVTIRDSSGHSALDDAALETVRQWRFSPARQGGRTVASAIEVPIRFSLTDG